MLNTLKSKLLHYKGLKQKDSILIFADPRSGSTWLAEIISKNLNTCLIDEPLHLNNDQRLLILNLGWRPYIPENANHIESINFFKDLFAGRNITAIGLHKNSLKKIVTCDKLSFKIIRGKLLIPYLLKNFEFNYKPIFLIRHPIAVLQSMKEHSGWNFAFKPFNIPNISFNDKFVENGKFLASLKSQEEVMLSLWCISNQPFCGGSIQSDKLDIVYYEELVRNPIRSLSKLSIFENAKLEKKDFSFASQTVGISFQENSQKQVDKWQDYFSHRELDSFQKIMDHFNINIYNSRSSSPLK